MKKGLITVGACLTLALTLAACGSQSSESKSDQTAKSSKQEKQKKADSKKSKQAKNDQRKEQKDQTADQNKSEQSAAGANQTNEQSTATAGQQPTKQNQSNDSASQANVYYEGSKETNLPTTNGVDNVTSYWPATITINGTKQPVIASYTRMGYFQIFTKQPTAQDYSFTYDGEDYQNYIGASDLDSIRNN
ncbi:hypothetical protein M3M38_04220 [Fructilactobacillus cliffordii]|uniref:hypothetical protein n=1 Tax=Fructilactobacillus cliffordii TaxID=2940299 RepID=UPI0020923E8D|nr:hypothetical protein [Fructilactobacillus cliffordii]USS85922.1 hypothetical protein M3M38_04220 [Fructilactobacillus cliffordii]